ncbi:hypothetical protein Pint_24351 [Pistacia integerrima]|uniref:Uncharacterized protein n=1 Tax=Pistacia integerrima TaxID=434235 RepID=A0ACC0YAJ2_9ROSI|nr:hypothetical protein Pint_24351 [Pistacia integerrima]
MASLACNIPTFFVITSILFSSINGNSAQSPTRICPHFDCGNGITIRYPFWLQALQLEHCGYEGLNLSCHAQIPILNLSSDLYQVRSINYLENSLIVSHTELTETNNCKKIHHDFTLTLTNSYLFNFTSGNKLLRFFYNCTLYPPSLPDIACLQSGAKRSFVFTIGAIPEFDWHGYCESTVSVPVLEKALDDKELLVSSIKKALPEGFKLTWRTPSGSCQLCEAFNSNGFCGYTNSSSTENFFCICPDGRHSISCPQDVVVSASFELNSVGSGAIVLGGLMIVATVFYFVQKKKNSLYKPVSRR